MPNINLVSIKKNLPKVVQYRNNVCEALEKKNNIMYYDNAEMEIYVKKWLRKV